MRHTGPAFSRSDASARLSDAIESVKVVEGSAESGRDGIGCRFTDSSGLTTVEAGSKPESKPLFFRRCSFAGHGKQRLSNLLVSRASGTLIRVSFPLLWSPQHAKIE